ncbi:MAG: TM2 domain-containing protein [Gemmatimonadota bacterium]|nr:TM2 domain-containing protein [Gemmatimonadota bacterium]
MTESRTTEGLATERPVTGGSATGGPAAPRDGAVRGPRAADFSRAVLEDLYRYPQKKKWIARLLWLFTGLFGTHRFYLDRTGSGLLMMFTGGGALAWWIVDGFLIGRLVSSYNEDQALREQEGLPPRSLSFMPPLRGAMLPPVPEWAAKRSGRARIFFDAILLSIFGSLLGANTLDSGNPEPVIAVVALIAITLLGARWDALARIPILDGFDRWNHRLRLFYYVTDPGGPLRLALRPIVGLVIAPFRKRARAEARLYMQLGVVFTIAFTILDVGESLSGAGGIGIAALGVGAVAFTLDMLRTLLSVYIFAAPIGAILTTHLLLERTDRLIWALSAITLVSVVLGFFGSGLPSMF